MIIIKYHQGDNATNFLHKFLLTNRQVSNLRKAFANHLSADIKLPKTQLSKMIESERFVGRLLEPLLKTELPLIKNVIKPLTAAASKAVAGIHKQILGSGNRSSSLVLRLLLRIIQH